MTVNTPKHHFSDYTLGINANSNKLAKYTNSETVYYYWFAQIFHATWCVYYSSRHAFTTASY